LNHEGYGMTQSQDPAGLLGTWRQLSAVTENIATGEQRNVFREKPVGFVQFTSDGRVTLITIDPVRKKPAGDIATAEEASELYRTMIAYGGTFSIAGNSVTYDLDITWNENWTGSLQLRYWELRDGKLFVWTPEFDDPFKGGRAVHRLSFEKMKPGDNRL
jgi:Lipocalin-like domain